MKRSATVKRPLLLALCVVLPIGCTNKVTVTSQPDDGIPSKAIGLNKYEITEIPDPLLFRLADDEPGDVPIPARPFLLSPPVIAHTLEGMVPITRSVNECVECHAVPEKELGEATPIAASHYVDLRNAPADKRSTVAGARYNCLACHVAQSAVQPLVGNNF